MKEQQPIPRGGIGYRVFKHYVRFLHSRVFYKKVYYIGKENIPEQGVPVVFASNHQNCACDPLLLLLGLENESHPYVVARGDVFGKSPIADKFFNWLGLVPAFRLNFDGAEALQKNEAMLATTEQKLLEGNRLIIFPEGGHQDKHYLGEFSFGYTRLAFQAAEKANFEKDIVIVPCCNHYSDYFEAKTEALYRFGEPVHLQSFYELYKTKPRTAQREVNKIVRQRIQAMMLDVQDVENYDVVDWTLSNSPYKGEGEELPSSIDTNLAPSLCREGRGGSSTFLRILNALLDGGKAGVEVGIAIIPGVLIISTLVMVLTFGAGADGYDGAAYQGTALLPWLAGKISFVFDWLFGLQDPHLVAFPITALGAVGAALGLIPSFMEQGWIDGNAIAVFTAIGMCWSGFLSTHTAMLDSIGYRQLTSKAILAHTIGGLAAAFAAHWLFVLVSYFL